MKKVEVVEIHGNNLVLGVVLLYLHCDNPLYRFLECTLHNTMSLA